MKSIVTTKNGQVTDVKGKVSIVTETEQKEVAIGEVIPEGTTILIAEQADLAMQFDDGTSFTSQNTETLAVSDSDALNEIEQLQALIASGEDPTAELPETAAGNTNGNEGGSDFISVNRTGAQTIANAGYTTSGIEQTPPTSQTYTVSSDDAPTVTENDSNTIAEDGIATGNVLDNDIDFDTELSVISFSVDGQTVTAGTTVNVEGGSLVINADGSYTFTPNDNWNGSVPVITYTTNTGESATLTINVTPVDDPSVLANDSDTVSEDTVASGNVLDNDSDIDSELSVVSFSVNGQIVTAGTTVEVEGGSLVINADGSYTFTPNDNWNGSVPVITYTTNTGESATLTINVTPVDDPSILANDSNTVSEDTVASGNVLDNDSDIDSELSVVSFEIDGNSYIAGNVATLDGGIFFLNADGSYSFVPNENWNGNVPVVTYITNTGESATLTIVVTPVDDATNAVDDYINVPEDTVASGNVLDNDSDADDTLSVVSFEVNGNNYAAGSSVELDGGTLVLNADGSYSFTPNADWNGYVPEVTYTTNTGESATLTINVTPVDDPSILANDSNTVAEDTIASGNVLDNDSDIDSELSVVSFSVDGQTVTAGTTIDVEGGSLVVNADGSYTFTPNQDWNGSVPVITYTTNTGESATLTINVTPVDDPSILANDSNTVAEDTIASGNVLDNDSDIDSELSVVSFSVDGQTVTAGTTVDVEGGSLVINTDGSYTFTPNDNWNGSVPAITYTTNTGESATLTIIITPEEDPSIISGDLTGTGLEDGSISGTLSVTDADGVSDGSIFSISGNPANGSVTINAATGAWVYTPIADYNGSDSFTVTITDDEGHTTTQVITVDVTPVADIVADSISTDEDTAVTFNPLGNDNFENSNATITGVTNGANGTVVLNADGTVTYTPAPDFHGSDSFTYTVTSGGVTETTTVTVNVGSVDDPSIISGDLTGTGLEDGSISGTLSVTDADGVSDGSVFSISGNPANGSVTINAATGAWVYTPIADYNGSDSFTVTITDDEGHTTTQVITVDVTPVADIVADSISTNEDTAVTFNPLGNDNFENSNATITGVTNGANGTVVLNADGTVTYTPAPDFHGSDSFTYTVTSGGVTETTTVTVNVGSVDDPSIISGDLTGTGLEDGSISGTLSVTDADGVSDGSVFSISGNPANGSVTINAATGAWVYTPIADYNGSDSFTVTITDDEGHTTTQVITVDVTPVADIVADSISTNEDTAVTFNPLGNDNFENSNATITGVTNGANGTVVLNADGTVTYTPAPDFHGSDSFTYTVTSGGVTETTTVTVNVGSVDDPSIISGDLTGTGLEDGSISGTLSVTDADGVSDGSVFSISGNPANGSVTINAATGAWVYTPIADYNGSDSFTVTITDDEGHTTTQVITVDVTPVADIVADSISTNEDTAVTFNPLGNDNFENSNATITGVTNGANGTVVLNADGTVTYTPAPDFHGSDSFTYTVTSGGVTETTTVTVNVGSVDDPSIISGDLTGTGLEDGSISGTLSVTDADGVSDGSVFSISGNPANGSVTINAATGAWVYTPIADYNGSDSFTVTITDDEGHTTTQVITVDVTPVADIVADSISTDEDTAVTFNPLGNDNFENSNATITGVTNGANGTVVINADGTVTYTPAPDFHGSDSFTYTVTSGGVTETTTVTVNVGSVDDPSIISGDLTGTGLEDGSISGTLSVTDADGVSDGSVFSISGNPANGSVTINAATGAWVYTPIADYNGSDSFTVTITDDEGHTTTQVITVDVTPVADIVADSISTNEDTAVTFNPLGNDNFENSNATITGVTNGANGTVVLNADGTVTYTPAPDFHGSDSFTYTVTSGGVTETTTVTVNVGSVDDPSIISGDLTGTGLEDGSISGTLSVTDADGVSDGSVFSISGNPANGSVTINAATGAWVYTPIADYNGSDSFTVTITDDEGHTTTQVITVDVTPVADIVADSISTNEDTAVTFNPLGNDNFENSNATITGVTNGANGTVVLNADGTVTYTPAPDFHGSDSFTYTVTSGGVTETTTVTVNVGSVDDPSIISGDLTGTGLEDGSISGTLSVTDADGVSDGSVFSISGNPANGSVTINAATGAWVYTPIADYNGSDSFTVTITDDEGHTTTQVITVDVTPVADIVADSISTNEDTAVTFNPLGNDNFENSNATITGVTNGANGTVVLNADGTVTYTPAPDFHGSDSFTYTVTSGGVTETTTVTVNVGSVDDPSIISGDLTGTGLEDGSISGTLSVTDADGVSDGSVFSISGNPANGSVTINAATGAWVYTPIADYNGSDSFTVTITDDEGHTTTQVITVDVTPVADIVADSISTNEDTAVTFNPLGNDNFENSNATITGVTNGANGTVVLNADGTVTYTPAPDFHGSDSFTYTVTSGGVTETTTVTVNVGSVDDPSIISGDLTGTGLEDGSISGTLSVTDADGVSDGSVFSISGNPANGSVTINAATGAWVYTPIADYNGSDSFTVTITDDEGHTTTQVITVDVTPVADIVADSISTDEDTAVTFNPLGNDNFENSNATITGVTNGANGTVVINADGTVTYTPAPDFHGSDSFTYTVTSGGVTETTTVTVNVGSVDDPSIISGDLTGTGLEDGSISGTLSVTDADGVSDGSVFSISGNPANGSVTINAATGAWVYTPIADYNGSDSFTVTITDDEGHTTTQVITVDVTPVADIVADSISTNEDTAVTFNPLGNDNFENSNATITGVTNGANGTVVLNADGTVTYTPAPDFHGSDSFTYTVTSGGVTETTTVTVNVGSVDDPSIISGDLTGTGLEDGSISGTLSVTDADGVSDGSVFSISGNPANGSVTINAATGAWVYTPIADYNGSDSFTVTITDDEGHTTTQVITVDVTPVADIVADSISTNEDTAVTFNPLGNDNFENSNATITGVTNGANGTVVLNADGTVTYTPAPDFHGSDSFTYTVTSGGVTETTTVTVNVGSVDDPSIISGDLTGTGLEDGSISGTLSVTDADGVSDGSVFSISGNPANGSVTINAATGAWVYTPIADYNGSDSFTVTITDDEGHTTTQVITVDVTPVADIVADSISTDEDTAVTFNPLGNDNFENSNATITGVTNGANGTVVINADGTVTYTPAPDFHGSDSFTYTVTSGGVTETTTVNITVNALITGNNNVDLTVDDANTQGTATDSDSSALSFTAGAYDVTGFAFGNIGDINISGLDASISWSLDGAGNLIGSIGGNPVLQLSLSGSTISAGSTGSVAVTVTLLDNLPHGTNVDELIINGITVVATDASKATATGSVSVKVIDDGVTLDPLDLAGKNAEGIYNGVINVDGADQDFSADLSGNISGTGTFSDSGITAGGLTVFYYVDPANPGILIAYSDTSGTPSAYDSGNIAQSVIFTLAIDPNSDSYQLDLKQAIDELSSVTVANMSGGKGGNTPAVYVTFDGTNYIIDNNINDVDPSNAMVFTLTSTSGNISSTVNGNTNGFGVANAFVNQGEAMIIDYTNDVASASINFTDANKIHFKAYDANGNLLGEGDVTSGQTIGNLGEISYIEVSTSALDNHANFQFTGTSAENIVSSTVDVDLDFVVDVTDSDGDTSTGSIHVDLDAPGSTTTAPTALTSNAISLLSEADLYKDGAESDIQTLRFKSGSESISAFQFGDTDSIQVSGVNAKISWSFNDEGQLIGTFMGKEAIRLTLNGDRIESGEEGSVSVTAEILDTFPHNVSTEDLTISGIDIIAVDANGKTAASTYSVTVQDDAPEIAAGQTVDVTGDNIPDALVGKYSLSGGYGASNSLDFDGFTITARGFSSATNSELTAADVFSSSDGIGVQSVESPYHNIRSEVDFRKFADGSEGSEEIVVTLDANTLAYGVNIEFSAMFGGELEVGIVEFYRDGKLVTTQAFSSDAKDGNYAAIFEVLEGGFDQMVIRATDNGFGAAHGDNSDFSIKAIDFIGYNDIATGYATGMLSTDWGADGMGSLSLTGTDETGLLTTDGQSISTTLSGNTLIGETESGELVFKVEFTPSTGQWEFYQYQAIEQTHDGQLDFNVIATDSDGDTAVGHFAVNPQSVVRDYQYSSGTDGDNRLSGSDDHDVIVSDTSGLEIVQGENYNIAFVLDSSGSMGSDAVETAKNQLLEVFKTLQAAASGKHAGTVNIAVIDFDGSAVTSLAVNILDLNINALANNDNDAWKNILSGGYTDYKAAFTEAKNWFTSSDVANNTGHNVTYFITDGKHNGNDNPNHAFNLLNNVSEVEAIGLKNEVNESDLTRYDSDGNVRAKISVDNLASVILGSETLLSQGDDHTSGGLGNDIIFGDLAQFDGIDGQGFSALQKLVANETNQNAADITVSDIHSFITSHPEMFDTAHLNDGDDVLDGNQGDDILFGQGGGDELHGGSGDDLLLGGMGTDELIGGAGEDILIGGLGDDTLTGGSGKADTETDTFVWQQGDTGTDHITDFNINQDKLDLSDLLQGENAGNLENYLHFTVDNGSTTIEIDANNDGHVDQTIVLDGVDLSYLGTTDGQIINGLLGNDGNGALIVDNASSTESASSFAVPATHDDDGQIQHLIP